MDDLEGLAIICCPNCGVNFGLRYETYQAPHFNRKEDADDGPSLLKKEPVRYHDIEWKPTSQNSNSREKPHFQG